MRQTKYLNSTGRTPDKISELLQEKLESLKNTFSFQKIEKIEIKDNSIKFGFTTKLGTIVRGTIEIGSRECKFAYEFVPINAPFITFITKGLDNGLKEILS